MPRLVAGRRRARPQGSSRKDRGSLRLLHLAHLATPTWHDQSPCSRVQASFDDPSTRPRRPSRDPLGLRCGSDVTSAKHRMTCTSRHVTEGSRGSRSGGILMILLRIPIPAARSASLGRTDCDRCFRNRPRAACAVDLATVLFRCRAAPSIAHATPSLAARAPGRESGCSPVIGPKPTDALALPIQLKTGSR